ncbi:MAG: lipocalin-like domain-containing protein [Steroidobacterales bacterium]
MKLSRSLIVFLCCHLLGSAPAVAHDLHPQTTAVSGQLGKAHFPNSGSARAQPAFLRGLLLLHSFEYPAARIAFQEAEKKDPGFAMAYWGEALTYNQPLWREQDLDAARAALAKLAPDAAGRAAKAPTPRERAYLASVEQLFGAGDKATRDANYSAALGKLAAQYPDDLDARSLYALSLLGLTNGERNVANYMRAAAEAEAVLQIDPRHPGALHYLIHATDDPLHAPLGLQAARLYGEVAPAAAHAHHMPSHTFFALGLWDDAIEANVASLQVGRAHGDPSYHALLWLAYAYLQQDKRAQAEELVRSVAADVAAGATKDNRARLSYARAMWLVETRGTNGPDAPTPVDNSGITSINYFAAYDFARGVTAAEGQIAAARAALSRLNSRIDAARAATQAVTVDWLDNVTRDELEEATILSNALAGVIRFYDGDQSGGIERVREASARADHLVFEYGPPWSVKPLDELLGELLLAAGRPLEAAAAFRKTLATFPNRRLARDDLEIAQAKLSAGAAGAAAMPSLNREDLVGSWRLVRIEYSGPKGPLDDPFYHQDSTGLLTYDASGSMSVQIVGHVRPALTVPGSRPVGVVPFSADTRAKAAALDSYYAYFGTWDFDATHSTVTHHVSSALLPAETGVSYTQGVALDGNTLTFMTRQSGADGEYIRRKIWERATESDR